VHAQSGRGAVQLRAGDGNLARKLSGDAINHTLEIAQDLH